MRQASVLQASPKARLAEGMRILTGSSRPD
jgi:hypothetical protein